MGHHSHSDHDHSHSGHHHPAPTEFNSIFAIAVIANILFVLLEVIYAYIANSNSLLADAGHNLGDVLGLVFSWIAALLLKKRPSARYSYGFKRTTIIAAFVNSMVLVLSTALILHEAAAKFMSPTPIAAVSVMVIAAIGILVNGGTALLFVRGAAHDLNIKATFIHLAYDALLSFGVVIVGLIIYYTHFELLDPIAGVLIALTILWGTWGLMRDSMSLIMDGVPRNIDLLNLKHYFEHLKGVTSVHDLHVWGLSTRENALTVHLVMPEHTFTDTDRHDIEHHLQEHFKIQHVTIQIEKDGCDNPCEPVSACHSHPSHTHEH